MWTPQSWLFHCFQVGDVISLELLVTVSKDFCRNIQNSGCCSSRTLWVELLLHCTSKENELNGTLTSSKNSAHVELMLMHLYSPKVQEWLLPQKRSLALTLIWQLQFQLLAYGNVFGFIFLGMLSKWLWFLSFFLLHLFSQDCNGLSSQGMQAGAHWRDSQSTGAKQLNRQMKSAIGWNKLSCLNSLIKATPATKISTKCRCFGFNFICTVV